MAVTTVQSLIRKASTILQDAGNVRWAEDELLGWLNQSYQQIVLLRPDASTKSAMVSLQNGTRQFIPSDAARLIDIPRNQGGAAIRYLDRSVLDSIEPNWHASSASSVIEHFLYDANNPREFFVYPPAQGATVELVYSFVPSIHSVISDFIRLDDRYAPAILDYMLYRAYQKDADYAANDQRSQMAYQTFLNSIGAQGSAQ